MCTTSLSPEYVDPIIVLLKKSTCNPEMLNSVFAIIRNMATGRKEVAAVIVGREVWNDLVVMPDFADSAIKRS